MCFAGVLDNMDKVFHAPTPKLAKQWTKDLIPEHLWTEEWIHDRVAVMEAILVDKFHQVSAFRAAVSQHGMCMLLLILSIIS